MMETDVTRQAESTEDYVDLVRFCRQLLDYPQREEHIFTGSSFELPLLLIAENMTDFDILIPIKQFMVLPLNHNDVDSTGREVFVPRKYFTFTTQYGPKHAILRINSKDCHDGFTQLIYDDDVNRGKVFTFSDLRWTGLRKVCWSRTLINKSEYVWRKLENIMPDGKTFSPYNGLSMDWVDTVRCPVWPVEADEWKMRKRLYKWPSPELIEFVVSGGCLFVAKSHDGQTDNIKEFRFSFSTAEMNLIHSWSYQQKLIYHILRIIKSDVLGQCGKKEKYFLSTYNFKTLMLWACESKSPEFWNTGNISNTLTELLCTMIEWLIEKDCRNYFIPTNNMWDNLPPGHNFDLEVQSILSAIENLPKYIDSTAHLQWANRENDSGDFRVVLPNKIVLISQLRFYREYILDVTQPGCPRLNPSKPLADCEYFVSKMNYLHRALCLHRRLVSRTWDTKTEDKMVEEILECFRRYKEEKFDGFTQFDVSLFDNFYSVFRKFIQTSIGSMPSDDKNLSKNVNVIRKGQLLNLFFQILNDDVDNPLFFLFSAYEANFHYTAFDGHMSQEVKQDHWTKALRLCEEAIHQCIAIEERHTHFIAPNHTIFKIVINNEFANNFDSYINIALRAISGPFGDLETTEFSVHFTILDFLRYIKLQCRRKLQLCKCKCKWHCEQTDLQYLDASKEKNPSRLILMDALHISRDLMNVEKKEE